MIYMYIWVVVIACSAQIKPVSGADGKGEPQSEHSTVQQAAEGQPDSRGIGELTCICVSPHCLTSTAIML